MRSPSASDAAMISSRDFTARSPSSAFRWAWRPARISISSDLVMDPLRPLQSRPAARLSGPRGARVLLRLAFQLLAQQRAQLGGAAGSLGGGLVVLGQGGGGLGFVLGLDRQLQGAAATVHANELGLDGVAHLQVLARILDALVADVARHHVALHALGQVD